MIRFRPHISSCHRLQPHPHTRPCSVRHVPKGITKAKAGRFDEEQRDRRKLANVRAHSKPGAAAGMPEAERKKRIVGVFK